ncbi:hypothetical protein N7490_005770 [Penicillium lividum]|nr:hypothetical protein N7490_005770 [Penicillium lividum]
MSQAADLFKLSQVPIISISASQSLNASEISRQPIPTGLPHLDQALDGATVDRPGGLLRGQITEVFGPPGAGKTSLAMNIASHALREGGKVVWIDTSAPIPMSRLQVLTPSLSNFHYFRTPTLPHLLSLLMHPPKDFPPPETSVLIIDSISALSPSYFPTASALKEKHQKGKIKDKAQLQWLLNRRWNVYSEFATHLTRFANRGIAVLAINQAHVKIKGQPRATLYPVFAGAGWEKHVMTRISIYRDLPDKRFMELTKKGGKVLLVRKGENIIPFHIEDDGLRQWATVIDRRSFDLKHPLQSSQTLQQTQPTPCRKRKASDEIADSQDEDSEDEYDWNEASLIEVNGDK